MVGSQFSESGRVTHERLMHVQTPPFDLLGSSIWVWLKFKQEGLRRFRSMFLKPQPFVVYISRSQNW